MNYTKILKTAEPMLKGVLFNLLIYANHPDFDDYLQELRLKLYHWLIKNPDKNFAEWQGYLFQRFTWDIQNLRRVKWQTQHYVTSENEELLDIPASEDCLKELLEFLQEEESLTPREKSFVALRLAGFNQREIAKLWNVTTTVVQRTKNRVMKKIKKILL